MTYTTQKFNNHDVENPRSLLSGRKVYNVPYSQRNFSWSTSDDDKNKNQVGKFWNALLRQWQKYREIESDVAILEYEIRVGISKTDNHKLSPEEISEKKEARNQRSASKWGEYFIGPMVFVKTSEDHFDVVDGQQRLTVLTMIFCICRDLYFEFYEKDNIQQSAPNFTRIQASLYDILEHNHSTSWESNGSWRFQPNVEDRDLFNQVILPWSVKQHTQTNFNLPESFTKDEPNAKYLRLEEKRKYFLEEITDKDKKKKYLNHDSNLKIINSYLTLYEYIWRGLITKFTPETDLADEIMKKITEEAEIESESELHINPSNYKLTQDFFDLSFGGNIDKFGIDVLQEQYWNRQAKKFEPVEWTKDTTEVIVTKFLESIKDNPKDNISINFDEWLTSFIVKKKKKSLVYLQTQLASKDNFDKIYSDLKSKKEHELKQKQAKTNLDQNILDEFISNMIMDLIFAVRVTVTDIQTADLVFKTLNSTGEPLSTANLIKNHILSNISNDSDKKDLALRWDKVIHNVSKKPDDFLEQSLKSRGIHDGKLWQFNKFKIPDLNTTVAVSDDTLFEILNTKIKTTNEARSYVKELEEDIEIYLKLQDPTIFPVEDSLTYDRHEDIGPALHILKKLGYVYARVPIMTAWRHWGTLNGTTWENTDKSFCVLIKILTIWLFRYKTIRNVSGAASNIDSAMTKIAKYIKNNLGATPVQRIGILNNIQKFLIQYDDDTDFLYQLQKTSLEKRSPELDVTILSQITRNLSRTPRELIGNTSLQIEHVLPQKSKLWNTVDFDAGWSNVARVNGTSNEKRMYALTEYFGNDSIPTDPHGFDDMVECLGNLSLLIVKINIAVSNLPFLEKKFHFDSKTANSDLKDNGCALDGDPTTTPRVNACKYYSQTGISTVSFDYPFNNSIIPIGTKTYCPQHDKQDGYSASELSINTMTVLKNVDGTDRKEWTALSIMERTKHFVKTTHRLWQLPKIYCTSSLCTKYQDPITTLKGDLDGENFIGDKKCIEQINGHECGHDLEVFWTRSGIAPDLDVPTGNNKPHSSRLR